MQLKMALCFSKNKKKDENFKYYIFFLIEKEQLRNSHVEFLGTEGPKLRNDSFALVSKATIMIKYYSVYLKKRKWFNNNMCFRARLEFAVVRRGRIGYQKNIHDIWMFRAATSIRMPSVLSFKGSFPLLQKQVGL